jgi:uncharacterized protein YndB with AHSA1/START domain
MKDLPFAIDREVVICATRATVFRSFTLSARFAEWWGAGSWIDPHPGGEVFIRYPNGLTAQGVVVELTPPERVVLTFGYDRPDTPIPPGGSLVTITLAEAPAGTHVHLRHDVPDARTQREHLAGWRYQLGVLAHVAAADQHARVAELVDSWFAAWSVTDGEARRAALAAVCGVDVVYRDRFGFSAGLDDLDGHIAAAQVHLPARLVRDGVPRHEAGLALVDWSASVGGGEPIGRGTSAFELAPDGRIARVTGFWR